MHDSARLTLYGSLLHVMCCQFINLACPEIGGAIFCTNSTLNMIDIRSSVFCWCTSAIKSGAIYSDNLIGSFNSSKTSFSYCHAPYIASIIVFSNDHSVEYLSFYLCSYESSICSNVNAVIQKGHQVVRSINCSRTFANHQTGFLQADTLSASSSMYINICEIRDAEFSYGLNSYMDGFQILYANFVNNTLSKGIVYLAFVSLVQCKSFIFVSNIGTITSSSSSWSGTAYLIDCYFDQSNLALGNYILGITNPYYSTIKPTYILDFDLDYQCYSFRSISCNIIIFKAGSLFNSLISSFLYGILDQ